ncbi:hypothetical protein, partial [Micromonospora sp. NPDC023814]|uniref:hypothetical protein n=1 Tax=Micromonospora sp. NPDC023814 TaxID=3154596 RepID=UPI003408924E
MTYLFGFGLLILAGAVVVLFAMLGELNARAGGLDGAGAAGSGGNTVRVTDQVVVPVAGSQGRPVASSVRACMMLRPCA